MNPTDPVFRGRCTAQSERLRRCVSLARLRILGARFAIPRASSLSKTELARRLVQVPGFVRSYLFDPVPTTTASPPRQGGRPRNPPRPTPTTRPTRPTTRRRNAMYTYAQSEELFAQERTIHTYMQSRRLLTTNATVRMFATVHRTGERLARDVAVSRRETGAQPTTPLPGPLDRRTLTFHRRLSGSLRTIIERVVPVHRPEVRIGRLNEVDVPRALGVIGLSRFIPLPNTTSAIGDRRPSRRLANSNAAWVQIVRSRSVSPRSTPNAYTDPVTLEPFERGIKLRCGHWMERNTFARIAGGPFDRRKCPFCRARIERAHFETPSRR